MTTTTFLARAVLGCCVLIAFNALAAPPDIKLQPNVGSDRSWVYNVAADVSDGEPVAETLAIRFANSESVYLLTRRAAVQEGV